MRAHRGAILHFRSDPGSGDDPDTFEFFDDGLLVTADGRVASIGPARELLPALPSDAELVEHRDSILMPGFVDTHVHYPQTDIVGTGGRQLLDWLEHYTFPAERGFADPAHAREVAEFFLDELVRNGTTTALVFCSVHPASVQAFFEAAAARRMRMAAGKVLMDRNCPQYLRDTPETGERATRELLAAWHGRERLLYAITPRFAPTSSDAQLASAGRLATDYPDALIQTHVAENLDEVAWVKRLFPEARSYLDVYDRYGLLRERAIYAHCIHFDEVDRARMAQSGAAAAFCPSSNLRLGSGLFDVASADAAGMRFSIATDVAAGSSFSMLQTLSDAYKVAQLSQQHLSPLRAFYLATLAGARALGVDDRVGRFAVGTEADFIVLDLRATPLLARRTARSRTLAEKLLVLLTLGDDRAVSRTYILGRESHRAGPI
ncbi:MAG: guanine deaminase [Gammaproteobacteria bacterium 13_2_20CM_66_19]|nr:MAG: guanine deaminase [Gammaproteobacteria bacterium 13_2_20CM_66_19]TLY63863.1 MAG: guanine deaminase [Gammaproteobacteria bacterium]TLY89939.1 MAG: guanine deaminase [Gammaproteobacteria bacterium]TLZ09230.1 MAG: guanine deaminase [Gammaproteobacteria bacterium]TLZ11899.1 MAG: guanine deaminase [Gammaproteobacteria bacterium]